MSPSDLFHGAWPALRGLVQRHPEAGFFFPITLGLVALVTLPAAIVCGPALLAGADGVVLGLALADQVAWIQDSRDFHKSEYDAAEREVNRAKNLAHVASTVDRPNDPLSAQLRADVSALESSAANADAEALRYHDFLNSPAKWSRAPLDDALATLERDEAKVEADVRGLTGTLTSMGGPR
jgi:hypothetical protein